MEIKTDDGMISGSFDTTVSTGAAWRVEKRDEDLIGAYNGGNASHVNGDDGDLNYDRGLISQLSRVTHELDLNYRNFGFFGRMNYRATPGRRPARTWISLTPISTGTSTLIIARSTCVWATRY